MAEIKGKTSQDIQNSIRELIQNGILKEGELLPNIRALATELEVNRNTVAAAYKDLALMGIVISKGRAGTQVRKNPQINSFENLQKTNQTFFDLAHGNPCQGFLPQLHDINFNFSAPYLFGDSTKLPDLENFARNEVFADISHKITEIEFTHGAVDAIERILNAHLIQSDSIAIEQPGFITSIHTLQVNRFNKVLWQVMKSDHQ
jgi:DNA-binding transcriptional MocR family regulator